MKLILASNSWIRKQILDRSEFDYQTISAEVDERAIEEANQGKSNQEIAVLLATAKAQAVAKNHPEQIVIGADTFAVLDNGDVLHKPKDHQEAIDLSMKQSGQSITVITGIAVVCAGKTQTATSKTRITYSKFPQDLIEKLFEGDDATIRNSGLGFFTDAPGFTLVESFDGSYTGAMGMPMEILRKLLKNCS